MKFISELFHLHDKYGTNIFATSRFIPQITETFERSNTLKNSTTIEISAHDEDVRNYLDEQISQTGDDLLEKYREHIKTEIANAARGMFLLVQFHFRWVKDSPTAKKLKEGLKTLPTGEEGYDHAYENAMERIRVYNSGSRNLANQVLSWITCAKRPLTTLELRHAIAVEVGEHKLDEDNLPEVKKMVSLCAGLITVDEESNVIRLVHYTTQEYFQRTWEKWFPEAQTDITERCITYLSYDIFKKILSLPYHDIMTIFQSNALYIYAAQNWGYHARKSTTEATPLVLGLLGNETELSACGRAMNFYNQSNFFQGMIGVHFAAYFGLRESILLMLSEGADLEAKDEDERTPLMLAVQGGHEAVVKLLVDKGADLEAMDKYKRRTPLCLAAKGGDEIMVKLLIDKGADLKARDIYRRTPLWLAAEEGHGVIVQLLVDKGADLEAKDKYKRRTPLWLVVERGHGALVKLLVDKGADLEAKDEDGRTSLCVAVEREHEALARLLVDKGANLDARDEYGRTPLWVAVERGHEALAKLLVDKGADLEAMDENRRTPLWVAVEGGHEFLARLLADKGADLEGRARNEGRGGYGGRTPLCVAVERGDEVLARLLVDKGVNLEGMDVYDGRTPLWLAAERGDEALTRLLVDKGANLEAMDPYSRKTPLWIATTRGHEAVAKLLVDKGAKLEAEGAELEAESASSLHTS
ncbi:Ankyrin-1 [Dactylellina cionopaga]|nr:Ankyrin-1 [Dactylellina cionopaga]